MTRSTTLVLGMAVLLGSVALADEDKAAAKKPLGTWQRTAGDNTITLEIKADSVRCTVAERVPCRRERIEGARPEL